MPPSYQHIDLTYLRDFSNGNEKFIKEIISISVEQTELEITTLQQALQSGDRKKIKLICHKLRSSMGFMGINDAMMEKLKEVENLPEDKTSLLGYYTTQIIDACTLINQDLRTVLQNGDTHPYNSPD